MHVLVILADALPDRRPEFGADPTPYVALLVGGMALGIVGHLVRSRTMVAVGVLAVFLGTFALPLVTYLSKS